MSSTRILRWFIFGYCICFAIVPRSPSVAAGESLTFNGFWSTGCNAYFGPPTPGETALNLTINTPQSGTFYLDTIVESGGKIFTDWYFSSPFVSGSGGAVWGLSGRNDRGRQTASYPLPPNSNTRVTVKLLDSNQRGIWQLELIFVCNTGNIISVVSEPMVPTSAPSQPTDPAIRREQENGITRVYDNGLVVARQPNGNYDYYTPTGCFIGTTTTATLQGIVLSQRYLVESVEGCNGFYIHVWSLGIDACQIQIFLYTPSGVEGNYAVPRDLSNPTCVSDADAAVAQNSGWQEFLRELAPYADAAKENIGQFIADLKGVGPVFEGLMGAIQIKKASDVGDEFINPTTRARIIDELYNCPSTSARFRQLVDNGVVLSGFGNSWNELTFAQKSNSSVLETVVISLGGSGFIGPQFMLHFYDMSGCNS